MAKRFNDGVIDLSSLREKKAAEKKEIVYDADAIMETIPQSFQATAENTEGEVSVQVMSVAIMPEKIYLILHDGQESEPPFLMIGHHENNAFTGELTPATEEDLAEYNNLVFEYKQHQEEAVADAMRAERDAQLQEMLEKAETEEEREQIKTLMDSPYLQ